MIYIYICVCIYIYNPYQNASKSWFPSGQADSLLFQVDSPHTFHASRSCISMLAAESRMISWQFWRRVVGGFRSYIILLNVIYIHTYIYIYWRVIYEYVYIYIHLSIFTLFGLMYKVASQGSNFVCSHSLSGFEPEDPGFLKGLALQFEIQNWAIEKGRVQTQTYMSFWGWCTALDLLPPTINSEVVRSKMSLKTWIIHDNPRWALYRQESTVAK